MKKQTCLRAVWLTVEEVDQVLDAIENAKTLNRLDSRQRQYLEQARQELSRVRSRASGGHVIVPETVIVTVLKCIMATQTWLDEMMGEFGADDD